MSMKCGFFVTLQMKCLLAPAILLPRLQAASQTETKNNTNKLHEDNL